MLSHEYYKSGNKKGNSTKDNVKIIFVALGIALLIKIFVFEAYRIPSGSMIPTLRKGDHLLVNKFVYGVRLPLVNWKLPAFSTPKSGDIVIFQTPTYQKVGVFKQFIDLITFGIFSLDNTENNPKNYIKRTIGVPGDLVTIKRVKRTVTNNNRNTEIYFQQIIINGNVVNRKFIKKYKYSIDSADTTADIYFERIKNNKYTVQYVDNGEMVNGTFYVPKEGDVISLKLILPQRENQASEETSTVIPPNPFSSSGRMNPNRDYILKGTVEMRVNNRQTIKIDADTFDKIYNNLSNKLFPKKLLHLIMSGKTVKYRINDSYYFVMGDNRDNSQDSRAWGLLNENLIIGAPMMIYYPFSRFGSIQ